MALASHFMAIGRVQKRLARTTAALDAAGIRYAVVGGNAVASWVSSVDPGATRATKDVDIMVRRADVNRIAAVLTAPPMNFTRQDLRDIVRFIDPDEPSKKSGVHLVWADEKIRPSYPVPSPKVEESERAAEGFWVASLGALLRMKLTSFRDIDRVHVADMLSVGLVTAAVRASLVPELRARLEFIESNETDGA